MEKKHTETFEKFRECIDRAASYWNKADRISEIEQRERNQSLIYGVTFAALHVLKSEEYHELVEYIHSKGFNH